MTASATARDIANGVRTGALDPVEIVREACRQATARKALNAFTILDADRAIATAGDVKARLAAGENLPLAGVPLVVKDNIWVGGWRITQGSRLFADHVAPRDALAVARAKAAGAVVIGIGACSEFAAKGVTATPLHGVTHHPMDPDLTPGGSSGGNAAALAADIAPLALGTDAGGSSRRPPAHCGIVGFKPSQGAVAHPFGFAEPFWGLSCVAPMARDVADAALLFEAIAGPHPLDAESRSLAPDAPFDVSVLCIASSMDLGLGYPIDDDVAEAFNTALAALRQARGRIEETAPAFPDAARMPALSHQQFAGLAAIHGAAWRHDPSLIDPDLGAQIERGFGLKATELAEGLEASRLVRLTVAEFFQSHDVLITPTTPCVAWSHRELGPSHIGGREVDPRGHAVLTPLFNHARTPAISIPCGRGRAGLPVGLQIVGAIGQDRRVLAFAAFAERALAEAGLWSLSP
jgi:aspartyl-tRNA(Asn)/glutamyl-tRNA(Gln) amidotransferase subunit A